MIDEAPTVPRQVKPCFAVICWDGPDAEHLRARDLDGHLKHVERSWRRYVIAGPMREPGGEKLIGSLLLVLADSAEDALDVCRGDPYFTNGQFRSVEVRHFTQSIGLAIGGKIWDNADSIRARASGGPPDGRAAQR
jgi:hypothetical protein